MYSEALVLLPEDHQKRFDLLSGRAAVYDVIADREAQLADIEAMLRLAEEQNEGIRQFDALIGLANLYLETETTKAREPIEKALKIARELEDVGREGRALYYFGRQAFFFSDHYKAREYFESSATSLRQAGLISETAESLSFLSVALGVIGDHPGALEAAQEAVDLSRETGDKLLEGLSMRRLAIAYEGQHQNSQALPIAEAAFQIFHELGDISNEVYALNVLGILKARLGMVDDSEADFLEGLKIAESIGHEVGTKWMIGNISYIYNWKLGEYTKTLSLIDDQLEKARRVENESLEINLRIERSIVLAHLGSYESALSIRETILPKIEEILDEGGQARFLSHTGILCAELGKLDQAERYLDEAVELSSRIIDPNDKAFVDWNAAYVGLIEGEESNLLKRLDKIKGAISLLRERNLLVDLGDALNMETQLHLALLEDDQSHVESALECTEEALNCYRLEPSYWVMPEQIHFQHSRALRVNGREEEADEYLRQAYERVMMVAGNISEEDLRRSYLENVRDNREIQATYQERFGPSSG